MKKQIVLTVLAAMLSAAASGQAPARPSISPEYTPVHDPVVAFCDGKPVTDGGGTIVAQSNDRYVGVGHCAVVTFDGKDYIFMHGYDKTRRYNSMLITRQIIWDNDGWPIINL